MIFFTGYYRIAQSVACVLPLVVGIGVLAGVYLGGRTAEELSAQGRVNARIVVPAVSLLGVVVVCTPAAGALSLTLRAPIPATSPQPQSRTGDSP
jgi:predicted MFS family arabinose efflux permease